MKLSAFIVLFICLLSGPFATAQIPCEYVENVAFGKPVIERKGGINYQAASYNDTLDYKTITTACGGKWIHRTSGGGGSYIIVDLLAPYTINCVAYWFHWDKNFQNSGTIKVEFSMDTASVWDSISEIEYPFPCTGCSSFFVNKNGIYLPITPTMTRYIKLSFLADGSSNGWGGFRSLRAYTDNMTFLPEIQADKVLGCAPLTVNFKDDSKYIAAFYEEFQRSWDFGNGITSEQADTSITYTTPGTYKVVLNTTNCVYCNATSDTLTITVVDDIQAQITASDTSVCEGDSIILKASGGRDYTWNTGAVEDSIVIAPGSSGTYSVYASLDHCLDTASINLQVDPAITASISGTDTICEGASTTLTASGGTNITWNTGAQNASIQVSPTVATTYSVLIQDGLCSDSAEYEVHVGTKITAAISGDSLICAGETAQLNASGSTSYQWNTGDQTASIAVMPASSTTYFVLIDDGICTDSASFFVQVDLPVTADIVGTDTICEGESVTLTASGGSDISWSTGDQSPAIQVTPSTTTTYEVIIVNGACADSAAFTIQVDPQVQASVSGNTRICVGGIASLSATGGTAYSWSTGDQSANISVTPNVATTYTVIATQGICADTTTITVEVDTAIAASISGNTKICIGSSTTLTAGGGSNYIWSTGQSGNVITVNPTNNTSYWVLAESGNCQDSTSIMVEVAASITASIQGNTKVCAGNSTILTAGGGSDFSWNTGDTTATIQILPSSSAIYSVKVVDGTCEDSTSVIVDVLSAPLVDISGTLEICAGDNTTLIAAGGNDYVWNTGATSASLVVNPMSDTEYIVVGNNDICSDTAKVTVNVLAVPLVQISGDTLLCEGESTTLFATDLSNQAFEQYSWNTGDTLGSTTITPLLSDYYVVELSNAICAGKDSIYVTLEECEDCFTKAEIYFPNAFSPNNDGMNDEFRGRSECVKSLRLFIYNRWGQLIYTSSDQSVGWKGNVDGRHADPGLYYYFCQAILINGELLETSGSLNLIR